MDALVFIDETGSNIALTPCMLVRQRENEQEERCRATVEKYDADRSPLSFWHGSRHDLGRIRQHDSL
jgi:hypothetical protein